MFYLIIIQFIFRFIFKTLFKTLFYLFFPRVTNFVTNNIALGFRTTGTDSITICVVFFASLLFTWTLQTFQFVIFKFWIHFVSVWSGNWPSPSTKHAAIIGVLVPFKDTVWLYLNKWYFLWPFFLNQRQIRNVSRTAG